MKGFGFLWMLFAIATGLHAQTTGQVTGTVRDNTEAVIPGAEVTVKQIRRQQDITEA